MKRAKQVLFTITGIAFTIVLFLFAMYLPKYLNAFFDQKTLNHVTQRNLNLKTYELSYNSFYDKLHAIARCKKEELHVVPVQETGIVKEKEKLTKIVQKEINLLSQDGNIMLNGVKLKPSNFVSCETFTLYSSGDTERMKGITYWKILYQKKRETFLFYLDEEYHKIYALEVARKEDSIISIFEGGLGTVKVGYADVEDNLMRLWELSGYYLNSLLRYHGLDLTSFSPWGADMVSTGEFVFQDGFPLEYTCQWEREERKKNNYIVMHFGVNLEQMLQF